VLAVVVCTIRKGQPGQGAARHDQAIETRDARPLVAA
jgi:hypothetical protein